MQRFWRSSLPEHAITNPSSQFDHSLGLSLVPTHQRSKSAQRENPPYGKRAAPIQHRGLQIHRWSNGDRAPSWNEFNEHHGPDNRE